ncbi:hypothetical protein OROHE_014314 [Orobanche hederae]
MADEHQSIVGCIREIAGSNNDADGDNKYSVESWHNVALGGGVHRFIAFRFSKMFLHDYCYRLPVLLFANPTHAPDHSFLLVIVEHPSNDTCSHCRCPLIRACHGCYDCPTQGQEQYLLDASCAVMPGVVTHEAHSTAHFLHLSESKNRRSRDDLDCACCLQPLGMLAYECRTCQDFALHKWCAMLPKTVIHKFDIHPLLLTTSACAPDICEICEKGIEEKVWRYGCESCDQSFHVDCIPCLDIMYKIKSLVSEGLKLPNAPNRLWRGLTLQGHGHGDEYCRDVADEYDDILASD